MATVDDGGLIEAKTPGIAIVTGQAQAVDSNSGQLITYSQDEVHVHVIKLSGIKLFVPSTRLLAGEEIAIYAVGLADQSPFTFASANPGLSFDWSTSNMDVFSLSSVYEEASVSLQEERDFYAMLRTRNPGQGVVRISAKCGIGMCEPELATFTGRHVQLLFNSLFLNYYSVCIYLLCMQFFPFFETVFTTLLSIKTCDYIEMAR